MQKNIGFLWLAVPALILIGLPALPQSPAPRPIVVELFTSEGCSSCPPADALLRKLDAQPISGAQLIVLEEHVDYWDELGWKDPFSLHEVTVRQTEYADRLRVRAPYTPQMVIDGATELLGSDGRHAQQVLESLRSQPAVPLRISDVKFENGKLHAHVESGPAPATAEVVFALALEHAESQVSRGENGGRHLEHVAILRSLRPSGKVHSGQSLAKDFELSIPRPTSAYRLIAFLQQPDQGKIFGAAIQRVNP